MVMPLNFSQLANLTTRALLLGLVFAYSTILYFVLNHCEQDDYQYHYKSSPAAALGTSLPTYFLYLLTILVYVAREALPKKV